MNREGPPIPEGSYEPEKTPEELESERVAREKLNRIMDDNFTNFAIRYLNISEYEEMMKDRKYGSKEAIVHKPKEGKTEDKDEPLPNFKKFLQQGSKIWNRGAGWYKQGWQEKVHDTGWDSAEQSVGTYRWFLNELRWAHNQVNRERKEDLPKIRDETLENFRGRILSEENRYKILPLAVRLGMEEIDSDRKKIIKSFEKNPDFLDDKKNLRLLMDALANIYDDIAEADRSVDKHPFFQGISKQYQLALIFDIEEVEPRRKGDTWIFDYLKGGELKKDSIMAAVLIIPDKELYRKVVKTSSRARELSHPVFDSNGVVRYPKVEK